MISSPSPGPPIPFLSTHRVPLPTSCAVFLLSPWVHPLVAACMCTNGRPHAETQVSCQWLHPWGRVILSHNTHQFPVTPQLWVGPHMCWDLGWIDLVQVLYMESCEHEFLCAGMQLNRHNWQNLLHYRHPLLQVLSVSHPLFCVSSCPLEGWSLL